MKAIQYFRYGSADVLELNDIDKPAVDDDKVLVRVRAASVGPHDWHTMTGLPYVARLAFGLRKPKDNRLGRDLAGTVEGVGKNVTQFKTGDELFGTCNGAFAEYVLGREDNFALKPLGLTVEQAAAVPISAYTALQALRDSGKLQLGQRVLINGASGGVGTFAVQIAKSFGADVTGVCSTRNVEMVRSIGADRVIDYTREDFVHGGKRYELILDMVGNRSLSDYRRTLTSKGTLVIVGGEGGGRWLGAFGGTLRAVASSLFLSQTMRMMLAKSNKDDLLLIKELIESAKVAPVVDRSFRLSQVPEAIRYAQKGHAQGKVVITVSDG